MALHRFTRIQLLIFSLMISGNKVNAFLFLPNKTTKPTTSSIVSSTRSIVSSTRSIDAESRVWQVKYVELIRGQKKAKLWCPEFPTVVASEVSWSFENFTRIGDDNGEFSPNHTNNKPYLEITEVKDPYAGLYYCRSKTRINGVLLRVRGCPAKYIDVNNGKCYRQSTTNTTYMEAERLCRADGAHLAALGRNANGNFNLTGWLKVLPSKETWIGLDSIASGRERWTWSDGLSVQSTVDLPAPAANAECAFLQKKDNFYSIGNTLCWSMLPFLCEVSIFDSHRSRRRQKERCPDGWVYFYCGGYCYKKFEEKVRPFDAVKKCWAEEKGSEIAMPNNTREHRGVYMMTSDKSRRDVQNTRTWVGIVISRWPEFRDGTRVGFDLGWTKQGGFTTGNGHCLSMTSQGLKAYELCTDKLPYICQKRQTPPEPQFSCGRPQVTGAEDVSGKRETFKAALPGHHPWDVYITTPGLSCGGVLVSHKHVITAAECLHDVKTRWHIPRESIRVLVGSQNIGDSASRVEPVREVFIPYSFAPDNPGKNNFAVIELASDLDTSCPNVQPACLPEEAVTSELLKGYTRCTRTGWDKQRRLRSCTVHGAGPKFVVRKVDGNDYLVLEGCSETNALRDILGTALLCTSPGRPWEVVGIHTKLSKKTNVTSLRTFTEWMKHVMEKGEAPLDGRFYQQIICKNDSKDDVITCGDGAPPGVNIRSAMLMRDAGRENVCHYHGAAGQCFPWMDVTDFVNESCSGSGSCSLRISKLGRKICEYNPYLNVTYYCNTGSLLKTKTFQEKTHGVTAIRLRCGVKSGKKIKVASATYGPWQKQVSSSCFVMFVKAIMENRCNGKSECRFWVHPSNLGGDPCEGETKKLTVTYNCVNATEVVYKGEFDRCRVDGADFIQPSILVMVTSVAAALLAQ